MNRTMKRSGIVLLAVVFSTTPWSAAQNDLNAERAILYAKRISVSQLDSSLPKRTFAQWFKETVGSNAKIDWEVNDCGEQTGGDNDKRRDIPTCVEAQAVLSDGRTVIARVAVGSLRKGFSGLPAICYLLVLDKTQVRDVKNLKDLARMLSSKAD